MYRVLTYGTYDTLHYGHVRMLRQAKELGDYLVVGLSTDEFNAGKGKRSYFSYHERKEFLEAITYVDQILPESSWDQKIRDVQEHAIDLFVIGDDWEGEFDFLKKYCEVSYLPRTPLISSTQIKEGLST